MSDRNAFRPLLDRIVVAADTMSPPDALSLHHRADPPTIEAIERRPPRRPGLPD